MPEALSESLFDPIGSSLHGEKVSRVFSLLGGFGALLLYLEMPEQVGRTQSMGEYCKRASLWILWTLNAEIPSLTELPSGFSVAKPLAGA
jgi:hypothetical protein